MKVVVLMGPSSAGKSTLCQELVQKHSWLTTGGDQVAKQVAEECFPLLLEKLKEAGLIKKLSSYMNEDSVLKLSISGEFKFRDGDIDIHHQFTSPEYPGLKDILSQAGIAKEKLEDLTQLLHSVGQVFEAFPMPNVLERMLDDIVEETPADSSVIIDVVPPGNGSVEDELQEIREKLEERARQAGRALEYKVVLAYCPPKALSARIHGRNEAANNSGDLENKREGLFPFLQLSQLISSAEVDEEFDEANSLSKLQLFTIVLQHLHPEVEKENTKKASVILKAGVHQYGELARRFGLCSGTARNVVLTPKSTLGADATIDLSEGSASTLAEKLLESLEKSNVIIQRARDILRERFGSDDIEIASTTYLSEPNRRNVLMRITLASASGDAPKSVILKQSLPQEKDADDSKAYARFARDWAGLEFTNSIQNDRAHHVPRFYGGDKAQRFILVEDLGAPHISLVDTLLCPNREAALSALERYMKALGRFHVASFARTDDYMRCLSQVNEEAPSPAADKQIISNQLLPDLRASCEALGLTLTTAVLSEVEQVLNSIFELGPFTVLAHGDIAPDNVFDHEEELQLMDFEWSFPRSALLDGTYLRMSMPTAWCAKAIPDKILEHCEKVYREELIKVIPAAVDDRIFARAYTQACAYHALHQMAQLVQMLGKDLLWGSPSSLPEGAIWEVEANSMRPRFLSRLQAFIDVATQHDLLPNLREIAETILTQVKALWSVEAKPLDYYPAFSVPTLKLSHLASAAGFFRAPSLQHQLETERRLQDTTPADPYGPGAIVPYRV
jgi:hypothetical protein